MQDIGALSREISKLIRQIESDPDSPIFEVLNLPTGVDRVTHNQFLMFLKPESICRPFNVKPEKMLKFVLETVREYDMRIGSVSVISAAYLEKYDVMARHYGVINRLSRSAREHLSDSARSVFLDLFGKPTRDVDLLGGHEFAKRFGMDAKCLDLLWENLSRERLASGTYCAKVKTPEGEVYLVNGFHPWQLRHYTEPGRCIVCFVLDAELDWKIARSDMIGKTNPQEAKPESIRGQLWARKEEFGLRTVSLGLNGVHLSAGPLEALIELRRFCDHTKQGIPSLESFEFGRRLVARFGPKLTDYILTNPLVQIQDGKITLADLTEEMNSDCAIEALAGFQDELSK